VSSPAWILVFAGEVRTFMRAHLRVPSRNSYCKSRLKTRADSRCNRRREYVGPVIPVLQVDLGRIRRTSLGRISTAIYLTETRPYIIGVTQFDVVHASVRVRDLRAQTEVVVSGDYT